MPQMSTDTSGTNPDTLSRFFGRAKRLMARHMLLGEQGFDISNEQSRVEKTKTIDISDLFISIDEIGAQLVAELIGRVALFVRPPTHNLIVLT